MQIPHSPPPINSLPELITKYHANDAYRIFTLPIDTCDEKGRYLHWDKLRHISPPYGLQSEVYWLLIKMARKKLAKPLPFQDKAGRPLSYCLPDTLLKDILWISENATGSIAADARITDPKTKGTYLINSLIEEAISSSQLEGAATTRRVAKELIRTSRPPKNNSERMIVNNFRAMQFIREFKSEKLTKSIVFELHKILTEGTFDAEKENKAGEFRTNEDNIIVGSVDDTVLHTPPNAEELDGRLQKICDFANKVGEDENTTFIPPVIRAIIVHYMIGYDHPFFDGNGRTARALFYWVMAKEGAWLMEYISLSRILKKAPAQYVRAYLYAETDDNDVTYFIAHQLEAIRKAIIDLHEYLVQRTEQLKAAADALSNSELAGKLNHRQLAVLKNAIENPGAEYTVKSHSLSHNVTLQTARTDLKALAEKYHILKRYILGKQEVYVAPRDIKDRISDGE